MITPMTPDSRPVLSELTDVRDVPLADMPALATVTRQAVSRVAPGLEVTSPPPRGTAFQSSI